MSEPDATVSFQISIPKRIRNRFKAVAADLDLDMRELGQLGLEYLCAVLGDEKAPKELTAAIERYKKGREKAAE